MDATPESRLQGRVEGLLVRGGTSKGLFVRAGDLPPAGPLRDALALELFGSPDPLQVDGIGGSKSHTSKLMVVEASDRAGVDVDYTFGQVAVTSPVVDWSGNCGNLTSAVGPYAILEGLVEAEAPTTSLTLYNTNTRTVVEQTVPVEAGEPAVEGDYAIDGVPGTGARIDSRFLDPAGGVAGALLPTGNPVDELVVDGETYEASLVDVSNPNVFVRAADLGLAGTELPDALGADPGLLERVEAIRAAGAVAMGLVETPEAATEERPGTPQIALVSEPQGADTSIGGRVEAADVDVTARIFTTGTPHHAYAMTGAMCVAAACRVPGTIPNALVRPGEGAVTIGHPKGRLTVDVTTGGSRDEPTVESVSVGRTARPLMHGSVYYRHLDELAELVEARGDAAADRPPAE